MWVGKFSFDASKALVGGLAVKHKVNLQLYPFYIYEHDDHVRVSFLITFHHSNVKAFVRDLRKSERIVFCNHKDNFLIGQSRESLKYNMLYGADIMHLKPWMVDGRNSKETFVIGSRNRKLLMDIGHAIKEKHLGKMDYVNWRDIPDVFLLNVIPKVTAKQRRAFDLAVRHGYYCYPRKVSLRYLAKKMNVSYATFQAHLRKAENKLIPAFRENLTN